MDWSGLVNTVITLVVSMGGFGVLLFYRETKGSKQSSTINELLVSLNEMGTSFKEAQRQNNEYINELLVMINEKNVMNADNLRKFEQYDREARERDYEIAELKRKNKGLEIKISQLMQAKEHSEMYYCTNRECELREPKFGTFKSKEQ